jgi:enterochelin esterase-like enzyme
MQRNGTSRSARRSLFSRFVLAGVFSAATAGWFGVQLTPADGIQAAAIEGQHEAGVAGSTPPGVRDRAAWQPSPIPSSAGRQSAQPSPPAHAEQPAQPIQPAAAAAPPPGVRNRAAWQPSPIPSPKAEPAQAPHLVQQTSPQPAPPVPAAPLPAARPAPLEGLGALLGSLPGLGKKAGVEALGRSVPSTDDFIPMTEQLSHDQLEILFEGGLPAQRGVWRHVTFFSRALGDEVSYMAWLPPGYDESTASYPTLYLLHGVGGGAGFGVEEWLGYALTEDLDRLLALGLIEPLLVVLPNGGQGYWINHAGGGPRWADFVAADLVRHVDATFRTDARRERRAIGGLSMGGHGALQLALNHPDTFGIAGAHSPTLRPYEASPAFFGDPAWFARYDPLSLARATDAARRIATWIDVGSDDRWRPAAEALRSVLAAQRAPLEFRVLEGEHEGWYWQYYLPEYLRFYSAALHAPTTTPQGAPIVAPRP